MTALSLANLGGGGGSSLGEALRKASTPQSASAFEDAMARQGVVPQPDPNQVSQLTTPADAPVQGVDATAGADAAGRERVRRSLDLEGTAAPSGGDTILGGIQKLRGVFDARHAHINSIMHTNVVDTDALMAMQMEMAQYTILIDVSSKLTGKTTQSLDTLMKGQ